MPRINFCALRFRFLILGFIIMCWLLGGIRAAFAGVPFAAVFVWPLTLVGGASQLAPQMSATVQGYAVWQALKRPGASANSSGISKNASIVYVDLSHVPASSAVKDITANLSRADIQAAIDAQPGLYPNTAAVSHTDNLSPITPDMSGQIVKADNGTYYKPASKTGQMASSMPLETWNGMQKIRYSGGQLQIYTATKQSWYLGILYQEYTMSYYNNAPTVSAATVPQRQATADEMATVMNGLDMYVKSLYAPEIDSMIENNPNIVHFSEKPDCRVPGTDRYTPPGYTPASVSAAVSAGQAAAAAQNYGSAATASQSAYQNATTAANAARAYRDAGSAASAASDAAERDPNNYNGGSLTPYGNGDSQYAFGTRFNGFITDMKTTGLFALPSQVVGSIPTSNVSKIEFTAGRFGNMSFDFASMSAAWAVIKTIIMVMCGWLGFRIVTKGGA